MHWETRHGGLCLSATGVRNDFRVGGTDARRLDDNTMVGMTFPLCDGAALWASI